MMLHELYGYDVNAANGRTQHVRQLGVDIHSDHINIDLQHAKERSVAQGDVPGGSILVEWQPNKGWCIYLYDGKSDDPQHRVIIDDDGNMSVEHN